LKQTISEGRNRGAEAASGNCLVFINGDTIPENTDSFFEFISRWCRGNADCSDAVALACPVTVTPEEKLLKDSIFYTCHNFYVRLLNSIGLGMGRGECQIIKSSAFKAVGGYNEKLAAGEDFDLYRRIGRHGKIRFAKGIRVFESPRRFRKYGYLKIIFSWTINSLYVMFFGRSMSDEWEAVR
jgi:GT2 family glycosyltransferase